MRQLRVAIAVAVACSAARAQAQPQPQPSAAQQAKEHFRKGAAADREQRWDEAIREFEAAYTIAPHPDVLFNIAADHEHLEHWAKAAELFQRYLDERDAPAPDADAVAARIRDLRAKAFEAGPHHGQPPPPPPIDSQEPAPPAHHATITVGPELTPQPQPSPEEPPPVAIDQPMQPVQPVQPALVASRWHVGASYGVADGNSLSERYLLRGGIRLADHLDVDATAGAFGNNDYAIGPLLRVVLLSSSTVKPFLLGAATIGMAKQDASSRAGTRFPIGFEAGGGVQFGARGRIELDAVMRYLTGGWGGAETTAFSYANDAVAFAIDLGVAWDIPAIAGAR